MKTAKQWSEELPRWAIISEEQIAAIQLDALHHAAELVRNRGGDNEDYHAEPIEEAAKHACKLL